MKTNFFKKLRNAFSKNELYENRFFYLIVALVSGAMSALCEINPIIGGAMGAALVMGINYARLRYLEALDNRISKNQDVMWDVLVNDVKVGSISDSEYASIRQNRLTDRRTYAPKAINVAQSFGNAILFVHTIVPAAFFWVGVVALLFSPEYMTNALAEAHKLNHSEAVQRAVQGMVMLISLTTMAYMIFDYLCYGIIDRIEEVVGADVRKHCSVAAEGKITLVRLNDGIQMINQVHEGNNRERKFL